MFKIHNVVTDTYSTSQQLKVKKIIEFMNFFIEVRFEEYG